PQRLEYSAEQRLAAAHGQHVQSGDQRQRCAGEFGTILATPLQCRAQHLRNRDAQKRRGGGGAGVYVLGEQEALVVVLPDHADRVHIEQQARRAAFFARFRVVDVGPAEAQVEALTPFWVLVQEVTEVGGRRPHGRNTQEHASASSP